jgi:hypothetical protein
MYLRKRELGGMDYINLAEVRNQWWAPVKKVMNIRVS